MLSRVPDSLRVNASLEFESNVWTECLFDCMASFASGWSNGAMLEEI